MKRKILIIMTLFLSLALASAYPITGEAIETSDGKTIEAGITPDSALYGIDVALDRINFALTSEDNKAQKGLTIARERLLEVKQMINEDKINESLKAQERHQEFLSKVEESIGKIESNNLTEDMEKEIEIEKEIKEHETEIEEVREELKLKIKVEGEISNETQSLIDSILSNLENSTKIVEIKVDEEKGKTKIKIKEEGGSAEIEIEREIKRIEERMGLSGFQEERAQKMFNRSEKKWQDLIEKVEKYNLTMPNRTEYDRLIQRGDEELIEGNYEEAKDYYEEAKDYAEDLKEEIEERYEETREELEDIEIEVEVKNRFTKIEVEAFDEEIEFISEKKDIEEIIQEISDRTGLSIEKIRSNLEYEEDFDDDDDEEDDDEEDDDEEDDDEEDDDEEDDDEEDEEDEEDEDLE